MEESPEGLCLFYQCSIISPSQRIKTSTDRVQPLALQKKKKVMIIKKIKSVVSFF
jgi:hypothetical protein